jgi:hypothetical protein
MRDPDPHFGATLEFLGVDPTYRPASFAVHNPAHESRGGPIGSLARSRLVQFAAWRVLPRAIGEARALELARRVVQSPLLRRTSSRPGVSPEVRQRLEAEFAPDVQLLSKLLDQDLAALWFGASAMGSRPPGTVPPVPGRAGGAARS